LQVLATIANISEKCKGVDCFGGMAKIGHILAFVYTNFGFTWLTNPQRRACHG
jgi:hypothetical protein